MGEIDRRSSSTEQGLKLSSPGPYIARIVNNLDPMRQGSLEVELLRNVGNQNAADQQLYVVRYLSPFYGVTDVELNGNDPNEFNQTQKSYGFWMVPPDTGSLVMVIFVDSDPGQGYWMGCVQDAYMNHMVPGLAGSSAFQDGYRKADDTAWDTNVESGSAYFENPTKLPVGEFNRLAIRSGTSSVNPAIDENKKPIHPMADVLRIQGTLKDAARGTHSSSARRDIPSAVFGISTPGPIDKRENAAKAMVGRRDNKVNKFISRLGGHSIVMDDGNDRRLRKYKPSEGPSEYVDLENNEQGGIVNWPEDESFRIRTRTGHQILLHNSEDLIYITNSTGTAWMEFTSNGKIDIYCKDSISIHSEQDFNFVADRDISLHAGRSLNLFASQRINAHSVDHTSIKSGVGVSMQSETRTTISSPQGMHFDSKQLNLNLEEIKLTANTIDLLSNNAFRITAKGGNLELKSSAETLISAGGDLHLLSAASTYLTQVYLNLLSYNMTKITTTSGATHIKSSDQIILKGSQIHLNGPEPTAASAAKQAHEASAADASPNSVPDAGAGMGSGGSGGVTPTGQTGGLTNGVLTLYPNPGTQPSIVKRVPTKEPWPYHENLNPPGHIPDLTDRESEQMPYAKDEEQITIRKTDDIQSVPESRGGNGGADYNPATQFNMARQKRDFSGSTTDPNQAVDIPQISDRQLSRMPSDWVQDKEFLEKAQKLASKYGCKTEELLALMWFETASTMSPSIQNSMKFTGLIQFGKKAADSIGTSVEQLKMMSRAQQMDYVEKYFDLMIKTYKPKKLDAGSLYMMIALPAHVNKDDDAVLYVSPHPYWSANPSWRNPKPNGPVTPRGVRSFITAGRHLAEVKGLLAKGGASTSETPGGAQTPTPAPAVTPQPPPTP